MALFEVLFLKATVGVYSADHLNLLIPARVVLLEIIFVHISLNA